MILRDGFLPSDNDYDCLGDGVYFFEDDLAQGEDCMDLKDCIGWVPPGGAGAR